jgi:hypothetical protein
MCRKSFTSSTFVRHLTLSELTYFYLLRIEALAKVLKLKCSRKLQFACFLCFQYITKRRLKPAATGIGLLQEP